MPMELFGRGRCATAFALPRSTKERSFLFINKVQYFSELFVQLRNERESIRSPFESSPLIPSKFKCLLDDVSMVNASHADV